jgi:hypothetical protein
VEKRKIYFPCSEWNLEMSFAFFIPHLSQYPLTADAKLIRSTDLNTA